MIIDFRVQPPFKSFLDIYFYRKRPAVQDPVKFNAFSIGRRESASYVNRSIELFVEEIDASSIDLAVIQGQRSGPKWGAVYERRHRRADPALPGSSRRASPGVDPRDPDPPGRDPPQHRGARLPRHLGASRLERSAAARRRPARLPDLRDGGRARDPDDAHEQPRDRPRHELRDAGVRAARRARLPAVTFIIGHACWPWTVQACALAMRCQNVYLMPEIYMHVPNMPGADDYVTAANGYLSHRMLYSSCFPTRSLEQALGDFRRPRDHARVAGADARDRTARASSGLDTGADRVTTRQVPRARRAGGRRRAPRMPAAIRAPPTTWTSERLSESSATANIAARNGCRFVGERGAGRTDAIERVEPERSSSGSAARRSRR